MLRLSSGPMACWMMQHIAWELPFCHKFLHAKAEFLIQVMQTEKAEKLLPRSESKQSGCSRIWVKGRCHDLVIKTTCKASLGRGSWIILWRKWGTPHCSVAFPEKCVEPLNRVDKVFQHGFSCRKTTFSMILDWGVTQCYLHLHSLDSKGSCGNIWCGTASARGGGFFLSMVFPLIYKTNSDSVKVREYLLCLCN